MCTQTQDKSAKRCRAQRDGGDVGQEQQRGLLYLRGVTTVHGFDDCPLIIFLATDYYQNTWNNVWAQGHVDERVGI